jgi:hypothetical protein
MHRNPWITLPLLVLAAAACNGDATNARTAVRVEVQPDSVALTPGQTRQLSATPLAADGSTVQGGTITWSSGDPAVVSVSASGLARAEGPGRELVRATAGSAGGWAVVKVPFQGRYTLQRVNGLALPARISADAPCEGSGHGPVTVNYGELIFKGDSVNVQLHIDQICSASHGIGLRGWPDATYTFLGGTVMFRNSINQFGTGSFTANTINLKTDYRPGVPVDAEYRKAGT